MKKLISELRHVLYYPRIKKRLILDKNIYINFVLLISTYIVADRFDIKSPDPGDDYRFDLALTAHAKLLVTGEKVLLDWEETPVDVVNLSAFKQLF